MSPDLWKTLVWVSLLLLLLFSLSQFGKAFSRNLPLFRVDSSRLAALNFPSWVPAAWKMDCQKAMAGGPVLSIFDSRLARDTVERLSKLPFIERVNQVSRRFPRSLEVELVFRRPVALFHLGNSRIVLDANGVILPGKAQDPAAGLSFLLPEIVIGSQKIGKSPREPGSVWDDILVREGLAVVSEVEPFLASEPGVQIRAIDLSNLDGKQSKVASEIVLTTAKGVKIFWGRSALRNPYGEIAPELKIRNFEKVLSEYPGLDGVRELDLRFDRPSVLVNNMPSK